MNRQDYAHSHRGQYLDWCGEVERSPFDRRDMLELAVISAHCPFDKARGGFLATRGVEDMQAYAQALHREGVLAPGNKAGYVMYRDLVAWDNQMFGESAKALNLVADAIETGRFDHEAYNKIRGRLEELKKGPWDSDTAKDILKSLCKAIPIASAWCDDAFKLAEKLMGPVDCSAITCDCANVGGGLMRGPLIVTCKIQEQDLILQCQATKTVTGSCDGDAKGPAANY